LIARDRISNCCAEISIGDIGVGDGVLGGGDQLLELLDKSISLLSPLDLALTSAHEFLKALGKVFGAFFILLWERLPAINHCLNGENVHKLSNGESLGLLQFLLVLFGNLVGLLGLGSS